MSGNGDPGDGKLAAWTHYQPSPNYPDFIPGLSSPGEILDKDLNFVQACLDIVKKRTYKEYNPTPSISPRAAKRQTVTADSLCLSPHPQLLPSVQSRIHKTPSVISRSEYRHNKALLPPTVVRDKMETIDIDRRTLESQGQPLDHIIEINKHPVTESQVHSQVGHHRARSVTNSSVSSSSRVSSTTKAIRVQTKLI